MQFTPHRRAGTLRALPLLLLGSLAYSQSLDVLRLSADASDQDPAVRRRMHSMRVRADFLVFLAGKEIEPVEGALQRLRDGGADLAVAGSGGAASVEDRYRILDGLAEGKPSVTLICGVQDGILDEIAANTRQQRKMIVLREGGQAPPELEEALGSEESGHLFVPFDRERGPEALAYTIERVLSDERASAQAPWDAFTLDALMGKKKKAEKDEDAEADEEPADAGDSPAEVTELVKTFLTEKYEKHTKMWLSKVKCDWKPSIMETKSLEGEGLYEVRAQWTVLLPAAHDYGTYAPKDSNCKIIRGSLRVDVGKKKVKNKGKAKLVKAGKE